MIIFLLILIALILLFGRKAGIWFVLGSLALIVIGIIVAAFIHVDSSNNVGFTPLPPQGLTSAQIQAMGGTVVTPPKTKSVSAAPETGYQFCPHTYRNTTWDGSSYTKSGGYLCTCNAGYTSSSDGKSCVIQNYYPAQYGANQSTPSFYNPYGTPFNQVQADEAAAKKAACGSAEAALANAKNMNDLQDVPSLAASMAAACAPATNGQ